MIAKGRTTNIPDTIHDSERNDWRAFVGDFGIGCMNVIEAAELIALDMWMSGDLPDIAEPSDWEGNEDNPALLSALAPVARQMQTRLLTAIDNGRLEADLLRRDLDDQIAPQLTFIHHQNLTIWLFERGYESGDVINDWIEAAEQEVAAMCDEAEYINAQRKLGKKGGWLATRALVRRRGLTGDAIGSHSYESLIDAHKALVIEHAKVTQQGYKRSPDHETRPLSTRERQSLLCIIGALAKKAGIDLKARGAAAQVSALTERFGAPIGDETVKKFLDQIDSAQERRAK